MKRYEQRLAQKYGPPKKRLAVKDIEAVMVSVAAGDYVLYTDALAAVSSARADALRWALGHIQPFPNRFGEWPTVAAEIREKGINEYVARLRAIIENELNQ